MDIVKHLSQKAKNLKQLTLGCNHFSKDRQLSIQTLILTMGHVNTVHVKELCHKLGCIFANASQETGGLVPEVELAIESVCKCYSHGLDYGKLVDVLKILLTLKVNFPLLEGVDENRLFFD